MSLTLPPGYRFVPSDAELIGFYLYNRVHNLPFPCDSVLECDLYGILEPWQIWEMYEGPKLGKQDLYFFTPLKKISKKGSKICRRVGSGTWKGEDGETEIKDEITHMKIGSRKRFRYENKGSEHHAGWIMHEYKLIGHDEFVVCRIRKNESDEDAVVKKRKRKCNSKEGKVEKHLSKCSRVEENPVHSQLQCVDENEGEAQSECEAPSPPQLLGEEVTDDDYSSFFENLILIPQSEHEAEAEAEAHSELLAEEVNDDITDDDYFTFLEKQVLISQFENENGHEHEPEPLSVGVGGEFIPEIRNFYSSSIGELFPGENFTDLLLEKRVFLI
ncbi:hypothetical protein Patl1_29545 [Pistacia atlantica]|uniref:Uncharacterized protein n=1 Tax=Pistacia atlantica TaxID=434234 RepID=A0ACC1A9G0_9ROSI|nr:hypothetical protein Patl1_29545 [Pistacia atlantica]